MIEPSKTSNVPNSFQANHASSSGSEKAELLALWTSQAQAGDISFTELAERLLRLEYSAGQNFQPDVDRARRCGFGEVIYGSGKSPELVVKIAQRLLDGGQREVLVTRMDPASAAIVGRQFAWSRYDLLARTCRLASVPRTVDETSKLNEGASSKECSAQVIVVSAGSTDMPVAREALETLDWMGVNAMGIHDIGVAGPYRLLPHLDTLREATALVVVAGMEGALASVVGGLVPCPIIAVPTSVGYGANLQGITTLLSMLSSCAAGVTVVNVDAGFKGGYVAGLIARKVKLHMESVKQQ